ncbi:MAG TPA: ribonuclease P protein component [Candidatus Paceibacterota bacterium]
MLRKAERLTVSDIEGLSAGKSVFGTLISMRYKPALKTKVSVTVSKKVAASAVDRNRIRRRTYAAVEKVLGNMKNPAYAMLMPKKEFLTAPFDTVCAEIESIFKKAGLILLSL